MKVLQVLKNKIPEIAVLMLSAAIFFYKFGWQLLDVTNIHWLFSIGFDNPTEFISWEYYRWSPWAFPVIGTMSGYDFPTVTGVGLTGAIPLLAIPLKALSSWLPQDFQHFGWWLFLCYTLQGLMGFKLLKTLLKPNLSQTVTRVEYLKLIIGALFFVIAPPLLFRPTHMNLSAHFLILAALNLYYQDITLGKKIKYNLVLVAATALIHQYLTVMVLGLCFAVSNDLWQRRKMSFVQLVGFNIADLALVLFLFYIVGNFNIPNDATQSVGFGNFSANLNTFFNSFNYTQILPALKISSEGQYEGFAYLGVGVMGILTCNFIGFLMLKMGFLKRSLDTPSVYGIPLKYPIWSIAIAFFIFSLSNNIGLNETVLHHYGTGPMFTKLANSLRASGRFVWVLYYLILAFTIKGFLNLNISNYLKISILSLALCIQIYDVKPMFKMHEMNYAAHRTSINWATWQPMMQECERVIMYPCFLWHYKNYGDFYDFAHLAALNKKAINTGYFARSVWDLKRKWEKNLNETLDKGSLGDEQNSIFICRKEDIGRFDKLVKQGILKSFIYQDYPIFVPLTLPKTIQYLSQLTDCQPFVFDTEGVVDFLKRHSDKTILVAAMDEASHKLCSEAKDYFKSMGSENITQLGHYGSYIGIYSKNKLIFEKVDNNGAVSQNWKSGDIIKDFLILKELKLHSAGATWGRTSSIKIGDKELSINKIGLNFVVLNDKWEVVEKARFNTFDSCVRTLER